MAGESLIDTFNRANGALGTPSGAGGAWTDLVGTWAISSNEATSSLNGAPDLACTVVDCRDSDGILEGLIGNPPNATRAIGLSYRAVDANNFRYVFCYLNSSATAYSFYSGKVDAGVSTYDHFSAAGSTGSTPQGKLLRVEFFGDQIKVFYDGTQLGSTFTSSFNQTAKKHGLCGLDPASVAKMNEVTFKTSRYGVFVG